MRAVALGVDMEPHDGLSGDVETSGGGGASAGVSALRETVETVRAKRMRARAPLPEREFGESERRRAYGPEPRFTEWTNIQFSPEQLVALRRLGNPGATERLSLT